MTGYSRIAIIGALVVFGAFGLAATLFIADTSASGERLGLLFALFGTIVAALIGALRADQAASSTGASSNIAQALNGNFDARVRNAARAVAAEPSNTPAEFIKPSPNPEPIVPPTG
jgi:hypothetical protein